MEVYCRRVSATVRGVPDRDLFIFTSYLPEGADVESGGIRVEVTDGQNYWRTQGALRAQDLSQTLASGRMRAAVEALTDKFRGGPLPPRDFEYTLDAKDVLNIRFKAGKTMNRLRVTLQPAPAPAAAMVAALTGLAVNVRRLRAAVGALSRQETSLRSLVDWGRAQRAVMEVERAEARERALGGVAELLTEKTRQLRVAAGMPEEPEEEADEDVSSEEEEAEEGDLVARSEAAARRAESPDRGRWDEVSRQVTPEPQE